MSKKDYTKYGKTNEVVEPVVEAAAEPVVETPVVEAVEVVEPGDCLLLPKAGRVFNCSRLNVRVAPKPGAAVVCEIPCNTKVEINEAESTDDFYKIYTVSGVEGFCMKTYILEDSE